MIEDSLAKIIRFVMRDVTYHKHYSATIISHVGDSADVLPDDANAAGFGLQRAPVQWGVPGIKATITPGTKCTLYFADGDPQKPRICNYQGGAILLQLMDGTLPVARVGDTITGTSATGGPVTGIIAGGNPLVQA